MNAKIDADADADVDVAVIGAGPAGMAAAIACAARGLSVTVLDEQQAAGGQIYRGVQAASLARRALLGPDYARGQALVSAFEASGASHLRSASVWEVTADGTVNYLLQNRARQLRARRVVIAAGAMERPFPIPGWTLPGVMGAGAAQVLLKTAGALAREPVVLAGTGPLLYLLTGQYLRAGVRIAAVIDTAAPQDRWRALPRLAGALPAWRDLRKGLAMLRQARGGAPFFTHASHLRVVGEDRARALRFRARGVEYEVAANVVLLHAGVAPNTQISWSLRAEHRWSADQLCWQPEVDEWGELTVPGIYSIGDGASIAGAEAAALRGGLAGLGIACALGRIDSSERDRQAAPLLKRHRHQMGLRALLDTLYAPPAWLRYPADDVIVCRCEEVTAGSLRQFVAMGCQGPNQAKSFSRCGMGPCQGRLCGLTVSDVIAQARGVPPAAVGFLRIRAPIKPVTLGQLAESEPM